MNGDRAPGCICVIAGPSVDGPDEDCPVHGRCPAPAPGGRTREAREEIARALIVYATDDHDHAANVAMVIVNTPAVAEALAAVERVKALAEEWRASSPTGLSALAGAAKELRRALDGPP